MFLNGPRPARLSAVSLVDIHGTRLIDLTFQLDGEAQLRRARIGSESVSGTLEVGAALVVTFVMGVVTAVHAAPPSAE